MTFQPFGVRVVLIAGPSSSGKTTFTKRLSFALLARGINPFHLELDNYFVNREETPKDHNGLYDFEAITALDRERLARDLSDLLSGRKIQLPRFNFKTGKREPGEEVILGEADVVLMEGIHGLNPELLTTYPVDALRIYVSALTQLNLDGQNRVSTTDTRLIRRIVRDAQSVVIMLK